MDRVGLNSDIFDKVCGLRPEVWICVGAGFAREEIKALLLENGKGFVADAVTTLQDLCIQILGQNNTKNELKDKLLNSFARQEVLRLLLSEPRIMDRMPELARIKRQRTFLRRLDTAIQSARLTFAHSDEEEVYEERLIQIFGKSLLRDEIRGLTQAYEVWMEASGFLDLPLLLRKACSHMRDAPRLDTPLFAYPPQEIWLLSLQSPESLEKEFWDLLGRQIPVRFLKSLPMGSTDLPPQTLVWEKWHTLDDGAESIAERIATEIHSNQNLNDCAILIPDLPGVRRSLKRALDGYQIPLADLRDPTLLRWEEGIKVALLPLEVVASQFERRKVISWLGLEKKESALATWTTEINQRGVRRGLGAYSGGLLSDVYLRLQKLNDQLGGKRTCQEIADHHIQWIKELISKDLVLFLESLWKSMVSDMERVGQAERKAYPLLWLERLQERLLEASPPVERIKYRQGLQIYRLQQAAVKPIKKLILFALPAQWLDVQGVGSYWFTDRERDVLGTEFSVRSPTHAIEERLEAIASWVAGAESVTIVDGDYTVEGRERESILPVLRELEFKTGRCFKVEPVSCGAHPRFMESYGRESYERNSEARAVQPQKVVLSNHSFLKKDPNQSVPIFSATALDRMSRCSFQALGYHRWNLSDVREPDTELWPDSRGNLLHDAVRLLLKSRSPDGVFQISTRQSLDAAWTKRRPRGLLQSQRVEDYVKARLVKVLDVFCEKEIDYSKRSGARPISLDETTLQVDYPEFSIVGKPDRIDQHGDGLFVMDYKTSGTLPHGTDMIEFGYRLQLPFYAIGLQKTQPQPVLGLQFIELDRKGGRKSGIFFKDWNGKGEGALTHARSNSKSLISQSPEEVWGSLEKALYKQAQEFYAGRFEALPSSVKMGKGNAECTRCTLSDLCGYRRRIDVS